MKRMIDAGADKAAQELDASLSQESWKGRI